MKFSERLRSIRKAKGWSQHELAARAGIARASIAKWESGITERPRPTPLRRVAKALEMTANDLYGEPIIMSRTSGDRHAGSRRPATTEERLFREVLSEVRRFFYESDEASQIGVINLLKTVNHLLKDDAVTITELILRLESNRFELSGEVTP